MERNEKSHTQFVPTLQAFGLVVEKKKRNVCPSLDGRASATYIHNTSAALGMLITEQRKRSTPAVAPACRLRLHGYGQSGIEWSSRSCPYRHAIFRYMIGYVMFAVFQLELGDREPRPHLQTKRAVSERFIPLSRVISFPTMYLPFDW